MWKDTTKMKNSVRGVLGLLLFAIVLIFVNSPVSANDERTGYWWNDRDDAEKLAYVAGFVEGFNYLSGLLSFYVLYIDLDFAELGRMDDKQLAELNALQAQRANEFSQMKRYVDEISSERVKYDLDQYYKPLITRELAIAGAIGILHIEPSTIPDWMLDYRIDELKTLSDERYGYLKKMYLEEKQRREQNQVFKMKLAPI